MSMSNKVYDFLKKFVTIYAPAFMTMFNGLALVWHWDIPIEAIDATVGLVLTFLGVCLGISTAKYNKKKGGK